MPCFAANRNQEHVQTDCVRYSDYQQLRQFAHQWKQNVYLPALPSKLLHHSLSTNFPDKHADYSVHQYTYNNTSYKIGYSLDETVVYWNSGGNGNNDWATSGLQYYLNKSM